MWRGTLTATWVLTPLLQEPAQCVQRPSKVNPVLPLQRSIAWLVGVQSLLGMRCGRACQRRVRLGCWTLGGRSGFPEQHPQRLGQCLLHDHAVSVCRNDALELGELASLRPQIQGGHIQDRGLYRDHQQVAADDPRACLIPQGELLRALGVLVDAGFNLERPVDLLLPRNS